MSPKVIIHFNENGTVIATFNEAPAKCIEKKQCVRIMSNQASLYLSNVLVSGNKSESKVSSFKVVFPEGPKLLERVADCDKTAIDECLETYGSLVWSLTKQHTKDELEAEIAVQEVFSDIWKFAARFDSDKTDEATFISHITVRNLIKRNKKTVNDSIC